MSENIESELRLKLMVERAICIIQGEYGYTRERAQEWLSSDAYWNEKYYTGEFQHPEECRTASVEPKTS